MRLSKEKRDKISEQVLSLLYHSFPKQLFTAEIAKEIARDEEFIKNLLFQLKEKKLIVSIKKNSKGTIFSRRTKWQLSSNSYTAYQRSLELS